jgi:hypothetical protein
VLAVDGLLSAQRWVLERPEGKKGSAVGDREEVVERGAMGVAAGVRVAAGVEEGGGDASRREGEEGRRAISSNCQHLNSTKGLFGRASQPAFREALPKGQNQSASHNSHRKHFFKVN